MTPQKANKQKLKTVPKGAVFLYTFGKIKGAVKALRLKLQNLTFFLFDDVTAQQSKEILLA